MCGIVGVTGEENCAELIYDGLTRLEYRGYDSSGIATVDRGEFSMVRAVGKLKNLRKEMATVDLKGSVGIGHTRWATHGRPSETNAHPHRGGDIVLVHNGIIENHAELREELQEKGIKIESDTDTELVAHLVDEAHRDGKDLLSSVRTVLKRLHGAYALAVTSRREEGKIVVAKLASPLVLGRGENANFCASDIPAILPHTRDVIFLEDGDLATLTSEDITIEDADGATVDRPVRRIDWSPAMAEKEGYKHFMLKEIHEQPRTLENTIGPRIDTRNWTVLSSEVGLAKEVIQGVRRILLLACGTSHHAALLGKYYLEAMTGIPASVELASEYRGRKTATSDRDLVIAISQSGETLDTLMAAQEAKAEGAKVLAIANVIESAIPRMADAAFYTHAGPEIGVASTKCFIAQLANMLLFSIWAAEHCGTMNEQERQRVLEEMLALPRHIEETIQSTNASVEAIARNHLEARDVLFLGRGLNFPIALEGALKLKELSYVHAEGYAAGEMKHGPIALIDAAVPVIVLCPKDEHYDRSLSNLEEAKAREAMVIAIGSEGDKQLKTITNEVVYVGKTIPEIIPFLTTIPMQLFSYHVADLKGTDVDQPRNLAKTVTVE